MQTTGGIVSDCTAASTPSTIPTCSSPSRTGTIVHNLPYASGSGLVTAPACFAVATPAASAARTPLHPFPRRYGPRRRRLRA
jgi:hypothetical protein